MTLEQMQTIAQAHGFTTRKALSHIEVDVPCVTRHRAHYIETRNVTTVTALRRALGY